MCHFWGQRPKGAHASPSTSATRKHPGSRARPVDSSRPSALRSAREEKRVSWLSHGDLEGTLLLTNTPGMAAGGTHVLVETDVTEPSRRSTRAPGGP